MVKEQEKGVLAAGIVISSGRQVYNIRDSRRLCTTLLAPPYNMPKKGECTSCDSCTSSNKRCKCDGTDKFCHKNPQSLPKKIPCPNQVIMASTKSKECQSCRINNLKCGVGTTNKQCTRNEPKRTDTRDSSNVIIAIVIIAMVAKRRMAIATRRIRRWPKRLRA